MTDNDPRHCEADKFYHRHQAPNDMKPRSLETNCRHCGQRVGRVHARSSVWRTGLRNGGQGTGNREQAAEK